MSIEKIYLISYHNNHLYKDNGIIECPHLYTLDKAFVFAGDFLDLKDAENSTVLSVGVNSLQWVAGQYCAFVDICTVSDNPKKLEEYRNVKILLSNFGDNYWSDLLASVFIWLKENGK